MRVACSLSLSWSRRELAWLGGIAMPAQRQQVNLSKEEEPVMDRHDVCCGDDWVGFGPGPGVWLVA